MKGHMHPSPSPSKQRQGGTCTWGTHLTHLLCLAGGFALGCFFMHKVALQPAGIWSNLIRIKPGSSFAAPAQLRLPASKVLASPAVLYDGVRIEAPPAITNGSTSYKEIADSLASKTKSFQVCAPYPVPMEGKCWTVVANTDGAYAGHVVTGVEYHVGQSIVEALAKADKSQVMLDIGMNAGYFSILSAALGFTVHAFEPTPACVTWVKAALEQQPDLASHITIHHVGLGSPLEPGAPAPQPLSVNWGVCDGGFTFSAAWKDATQTPTMSIPIRVVQDYLGPRDVAAVVKMDVEGNEAMILRSLMAPIRERRIKALVMEIKMREWPRTGVTQAEGLAMLEEVLKLSSRAVLLPLNMPLQTIQELEGKCAANCDVLFIMP